MAIADVTVRGAGIFGLAVAWACARQGARVQVIDPGGAGAGASGGVVGALAPHAPDQWDAIKAFQFQALCLAEPFWRAVAAAGGVDPGYARHGRLQPLADAAAVERARARVDAAAQLWGPELTWEVVAAERCGSFVPLSPTGLVIRDTLTARLHPRLALAALCAAIAARGGVIGRDGDDEGRVIWATGHAGLSETGLGGGVKGQAAVLRHDAGPVPQVFAGGVHLVPHVDGSLAVGSTSEADWTGADTTDARLDAVIAAARAIMPALQDATVTERWAGLRPRAASRQPVLGPHPGRPGAFIANGGFKIGFGVAPLVAEVMADLVLHGRDRIPAGFRPGRPVTAPVAAP